MSTKNIALNTEVYLKLARYKRESESFSKAIERLLAQAESAHTAAEVLRRLTEFTPLSEKEADAMMQLVEQNRAAETWPSHDLS